MAWGAVCHRFRQLCLRHRGPSWATHPALEVRREADDAGPVGELAGWLDLALGSRSCSYHRVSPFGAKITGGTMRSLGLTAIGVLLLGGTFVTPASAADVNGACGYHANQLNTHVLSLAHGGLDPSPPTHTEPGGVFLYAGATSGFQPGDKVLVTFGRPNDVPNDPVVGTFTTPEVRIPFDRATGGPAPGNAPGSTYQLQLGPSSDHSFQAGGGKTQGGALESAGGGLYSFTVI